jgi:hypothetical protein
MKTFSTLFCSICSLTISGTAQAVAPTALYDNFTASQINPAKWAGGEWDAPRANLENLRYIVGNVTLGNRLRLYGRGSGISGLGFGTRVGTNSLGFRNPTPITAIKASVWANSATVTSCSGNPDVPHVRARLGGTFFNASASPIPGNNTYDVLAQIRVQRAANSTDAANIVRVRYSVGLCLDSDCWTSTNIGTSGEIGPPVNPGQKVTLSVEWDKANKRFIFRRDNLAAVIVPYHPLSDTSAPGYNFKNLQVGYFVANCASATPPTAAIDAYFDDVYTNPLSASSATSAEMEEIDPRYIIYGDSSVDAASP